MCEVLGHDSTWLAVDAVVDQGRKRSYTVDMPERVAHRLGASLVKRFRRKMYRTIDGLLAKAIGTMDLSFMNSADEKENFLTLVWEDNNITFDVRVHHTTASRLLRSKKESIERGIPVLQISNHAVAPAGSKLKQGLPRDPPWFDQPTEPLDKSQDATKLVPLPSVGDSGYASARTLAWLNSAENMEPDIFLGSNHITTDDRQSENYAPNYAPNGNRHFIVDYTYDSRGLGKSISNDLKPKRPNIRS